MTRSDGGTRNTIANDIRSKNMFRKIVTEKLTYGLNTCHIIGGCEWVDYMYHWNTLMVAHFSFDLNKITKSRNL